MPGDAHLQKLLVHHQVPNQPLGAFEFLFQGGYLRIVGAAPLGPPERHRSEGRQRTCRGHQQPHQGHQGSEPWLPQQGALCQRYLFPPWRTRSLPRGSQPVTVTHLIW